MTVKFATPVLKYYWPFAAGGMFFCDLAWPEKSPMDSSMGQSKTAQWTWADWTLRWQRLILLWTKCQNQMLLCSPLHFYEQLLTCSCYLLHLDLEGCWSHARHWWVYQRPKTPKICQRRQVHWLGEEGLNRCRYIHSIVKRLTDIRWR